MTPTQVYCQSVTTRYRSVTTPKVPPSQPGFHSTPIITKAKHMGFLHFPGSLKRLPRLMSRITLPLVRRKHKPLLILSQRCCTRLEPTPATTGIQFPATIQPGSRTDLTIGHGAVFNNTVMNDVGRDQIIYNAPVVYQQSDNLVQLRPVQRADIFAQRESGCLVDTRVAVLEGLEAWTRDPDASRVYWLVGGAGAGKSAISRSFARWLNKHGFLGGSFFCHRQTADRADATAIIRTLVFHLACRNPNYRTALIHALQDPQLSGVADWAVDKQVEALLGNLLARSCPIQGSLVVVVDALDECRDEDETKSLLTTILSVASALPIKWFITSRPEPHIRMEFESRTPWAQRSCILRLHEIERDVVSEDITRFLRHHFDSIKRYPHIPRDWPSEWEIKKLAALSGTLFIYAATTIKYIAQENPLSRLRNLTESPTTAGKPMTGRIDNMYKLILCDALDPDKRETEEILLSRRTLATILAARDPLPLSAIAQLLRVPVTDVRACLAKLHAVIQVPAEDDGVATVFHASFADYLSSRDRAADMHIDMGIASGDLAKDVMGIMSLELKFNISSCSSSYLPNTEQKFSPISPALTYACMNWAHHVLMLPSDYIQSVLSLVDKLLKENLLFWVEVLATIGQYNSASPILMSLHSSNLPLSSDLRILLFDANDFIVAFHDVIEHSRPHMYISALPNLRQDSKIAMLYCRRFSHVPRIQLENVTPKQKSILRLHAHIHTVTSVAFSPDGARIVSGSFDNTIRVWDASTGSPTMPPLKGHTNWVNSVAFSPDGARIVSGSNDNTIRVWDASTGSPTMPPLEGHTNSVNSVAFSPDGARIVSGSNDNTIRVWDASTGSPTMPPLKGHTGWVNSVAFSPDGARIVSGSDDNTIRVWDASTGSPTMPPLEGHTNSVNSVAFSPDGARIVSGSNDNTIRVWDASTGSPTMPPLKGHTNWVNSVAFSPDGARIVSGSYDNTIRVWDASTGSLTMPPLEGHTGWVYSVAFSPDGARIVSESYDNTIRVWDASTGSPTMPPLEGHTNSVNSVAFSPDGARIVSGSNDNTIRVWDASTGSPTMPPLEGHTNSVNSVAFSPDGARIVSGSYDNTIRVWDASTGSLTMPPLEGHTGWVYSVAFSPDGARIVSGSFDNTIRVWDASTGSLTMPPLEGHTGWVYSVAFSPDGARIVSGSNDNTIRVWDASTGSPTMPPLKGHTGWVNSVAFSPDGARIVSGSDDNTIRVWDASTGSPTMPPLEGHTNSLNSIVSSSDGAHIVSGSSGTSMSLWRGTTQGEYIKTIYGIFIPLIVCLPGGRPSSSVQDGNTHQLGPSSYESAVSAFNKCGSLMVLPDLLDGWCRGPKGELFMWLLPEFRRHVSIPPCTLVIPNRRVTITAPRNYNAHGTDWTKCYTPDL
ncbi:hypothetical protein HGRIS_001526 [Hohenbuehelia grisea]|uniref:NACHT domain-containing protein n=1 Tax=Hohenbuehelia grisea TaxID=104357 RepID=A0ABR3JRJ0_9AGAR